MTFRRLALSSAASFLLLQSAVLYAQDAVPFATSGKAIDPSGAKKKNLPRKKSWPQDAPAGSVLDIKSEDNAELARALTAVLSAQISMLDGFKAISRNDLNALLTQMETAQVLGCDDVKCAVSIAKAAKADYVVYGSVEKSMRTTPSV